MIRQKLWTKGICGDESPLQMHHRKTHLYFWGLVHPAGLGNKVANISQGRLG